MRILYIDIDSLRPDHLGCYGYGRPTSPRIDALAREAVRFENYYTSDAPCLPSRTAFYSGRFGIQTGVVGHGGTAASPRNPGARRGFVDTFGEHGLARQLQKLALKTSLISTFGQRHSAHAFYAGFNEVHNSGHGGLESAHDVWALAGPWLAANARTDHWYLHVNLWDPHTPYRVPLEYGDPFKDDPLPAWIDEAVFAKHRRAVGPHTALDLGMYEGRPENGADRYPRHPWSLENRADLRRLFDGYDLGVWYADKIVGQMLDALRQADVYEETAIVVSADHGENLGELGIYAEHATADVPTCRVPLIIKWPGGKRGTDTGFHYNVDFAPTIVALLGGRPAPIWDGRSFASAVAGEGDPGRGELILGQCAHGAQRSVRWANWLYLRTYHAGFRLFPDEMLFDLATDPHEQRDLAEQRPEIVREGAWRLTRWQAEQMQGLINSGAEPIDPLWTVVREGPYHARVIAPGDPGSVAALQNYLQRLEATDRADGAAALRTRYARLLRSPVAGT